MGADISPVFGGGHSHNSDQLHPRPIPSQYHSLALLRAQGEHHPWPGYPKPPPPPSRHIHTGVISMHAATSTEYLSLHPPTPDLASNTSTMELHNVFVLPR